MTDQPVVRDERTFAVADTSYRWAYMVLAFGVMIDVIVRGLLLRQNLWDLFVLVIVSSGIATLYQRAKHVQALSRRLRLMVVLIGAVVGAIVVAVMVMTLKR